ncbi:MAG: AbrB/MazE/SpoVT family DNA-binding domain-containing protein [Candidatus Hydrothermarchaeaceae archaeon]
MTKKKVTRLEEDDLKCTCGKWARPKKTLIDGHRVRGWTCSACGEYYINPNDAQLLLTINKLKMERLSAKMTKIGNSVGIRLPKELIDLIGFKQGQRFKITIENHKKFTLEKA